MYCTHCGKEIKDGLKFCPYCGEPTDTFGAENSANTLNEGSEQGEPETGSTSADDGHNNAGNSVSSSSTLSKKRMNPKLIGGIAVAAAVLLVIIVIAANHKTTVDLNDYISVSFEGYDTVGTAYADFDDESFEEKYKNLKISKNGIRELAKAAGATDEDLEYLENNSDELMDQIGIEEGDVAELLYYFVADCGSLDKSSGLSNGDTVTYSFGFDEDEKSILEKAFNINLKYKDQEFTVEGLQEIETYDPFNRLDVTFSGIEPNGSVEITNNASDELGRELYFSADKSSGLSNGDTITVSVSDSYNDADTAERYGKVISPKQKDFTVEGLGYYISTASDLPDDVLTKMQAEVQDQMDAYEANDWSENETLKGFTYIGNYILTKKSSDGWGDNNIIYLVYKVDAEDYAEDANSVYDETFSYYTYYFYKNVSVSANGDILIDYSQINGCSNDYTIETNIASGWFNYNFRYKGYKDLDSLYSAVVTAQAADYTCENNVEDVETDNEATALSIVPDDAQEYNGHYYKKIATGGDIAWSDAKQRCEDRGGHLAAITDQGEEDFIQKYVNPNQDHCWLGAERDPSADPGDYHWVTGEAFEYTDWYGDGPLGANDWGDPEYYMGTYTDGKWNDYSDNQCSYYICEWDSKDIDSTTSEE